MASAAVRRGGAGALGVSGSLSFSGAAAAHSFGAGEPACAGVTGIAPGDADASATRLAVESAWSTDPACWVVDGACSIDESAARHAAHRFPSSEGPLQLGQRKSALRCGFGAQSSTSAAASALVACAALCDV